MNIISVLTFMFCSAITFAQSSYWVETEKIDEFHLIEKNSKGEIINLKEISSDKNDKTEYHFNINENSEMNTFLQLHCYECTDSIHLTILSPNFKAHTNIIKMASGEIVPLSYLFSNQNKLISLNDIVYSSFDYIRSFIIFTQHKLKRRRDTALRGPQEPNENEPQLQFNHFDYSKYITVTDVNIAFDLFKKHTIKSIYIISHSGSLIFGAGDIELLKETFDIRGKSFPSIEEVMQPTISNDDNWMSYQLNWLMLKKHIIQKITPGEWYQIRIELEEDNSKFNPYLFNFQLYTSEDINRIQILFSNVQNVKK